MRNIFIKGILASVFVLIFTSINAQALSLDYYNASPDGTDILVAWEITDQSGVTNFKVFRKVEGEPSYTFLSHISPESDGSYQYLDYTIFKDSPKNISYKLQINKGSEVFTFLTNITHNPTSVQRTWGSIKAMFRN